jgi:hypothetical protein
MVVKINYNFTQGSGNQVNANYYIDQPLLSYCFFATEGFTGTLTHGIYNTITSGEYNLSTVTDTKDYAQIISGYEKYIPKYCRNHLHVTGAVTGTWDFESVQGVF